MARAVAIAAAVLLTGVALLRPLAGPLTESGRRLVATAAAAGAVAALVGTIGSLPVPRYLGAIPLLMLLAGLAAFGPGRLAAAAGLGGVAWLCWDALTDDPGEALLMVGHVGVAAVWTGAILASASAAAGSRSALVRRLGPVAIGAAVLAAVTGVLSARSYDVTLDGITVTDFGTLVVVKSALLVGIAVLGLSVRLRLRRRAGAGAAGGVLARAELSLALVAIVVGAVLTTLPSPGPTPVAGVPLARALDFDEDTTGLLIAPQRPGRNLVHLMTQNLTDVVVDGRRYRASQRPGSQGVWAEVELPAGRSLLEVHQGTRVIAQIVNTGSGPIQSTLVGPDSAECAAAALGAALGGSRQPLTTCPAQALAPADAGALRAVVAGLAARGAKALRLITDTSLRGVAAERAARAAAKAAGLTVRELDPSGLPTGRTDAVLAVAGWEVTRTGLAAVAGTPPLYGIYLAPWLVQATVVGATGTSPLAALPFDPAGPEASAYIAALRRVGPQESASAAGLYAFLAAQNRALPTRDVLLYAATGGFEIMPMNGGGTDTMSHGLSRSWLGRGAVTPVSGRLGTG